MASTYVTKAGDALDLICLREYGAQAGAVEHVLEANPQIRDVAHRLPPGTRITLPDGAWQAAQSPELRLWD
ncbi:tail protein X [Palleronia caenipelagi]|uniref:Phage tail protein n=1 Tax=Palleronia caenipelagi TaxID=2489174 RepID=A0A547PS62_9RHOB|nr:tail protein X [Palleronia caenipelagi]TRD16979.1 phage tail protein [Palleronia caenipelagi]